MQKTAQKVYEILTKLEKESIIDNETALAIFESMLKSVEPDEINNIFGNVPTFKSALDKDVANRTKSIEDKYKTEITSKDSKISELSQLIPKESDPEKIKKQLDLSTDPNERRLLQLEYNNAIATNQLAKLESEKRAIEEREQVSVLKNKLAEIAKTDGLAVHDPFMFAEFGENAETMMREYATKNSSLIEDRIKELAANKFAGTKQPSGDPAQMKMSLDEINELPSRDARLKAMAENGYGEDV